MTHAAISCAYAKIGVIRCIAAAANCFSLLLYRHVEVIISYIIYPLQNFHLFNETMH